MCIFHNSSCTQLWHLTIKIGVWYDDKDKTFEVKINGISGNDACKGPYYIYIKKALLAGEYKSGQELSLTEIAEKLGVSRTPVREAFQTLAAEGLIELRMNKGAIVKQIDQKFITDHYEMRILLESEAAVRAARNGMDVSELLARLYHLTDNLSTLDRPYYTELNQEIHTSIWTAADNQKLYNFLMSLWNGPSTGSANSELDHYVQSTEEHIQILQSIRSKDTAKARQMMEQHITRSMNNILKSYRAAQ